MPNQTSPEPGATICLPVSVVRGLVQSLIEAAATGGTEVPRSVAEADFELDRQSCRKRSRSERSSRWNWGQKKVRRFVDELAKGPTKGQPGAGITANPGEFAVNGASEGPAKGQPGNPNPSRAGKVAIIAKVQGNGAGVVTVQDPLSFPPSSPPRTPPLYPPNQSLPPKRSPKASAKASADVDELVGLIWSAYPKKVGQPQGLKAIRRAVLSGDLPPGELLNRVRMFAELTRDEIARGCDQTLTPHPSTFFNQKRYADDPETWRKLPRVDSVRPANRQGVDPRPVFRRTNPLSGAT